MRQPGHKPGHSSFVPCPLTFTRGGFSLFTPMTKVVWHDGGCVVFWNDGTRLPFKGRRYTHAELANLTKSAIAKLPGAAWKRFSL